MPDKERPSAGDRRERPRIATMPAARRPEKLTRAQFSAAARVNQHYTERLDARLRQIVESSDDGA